jgi:hypothetical protein
MERYVQLAGQRVRHAVTPIAASCLLISYPLLLAVALLPGGRGARPLACGLFAAVAVVSYLAEAFAARRLPYLSNLLNWVQVQLPLRFAFRELALIILLIRALPPDPARLALFAGGLLGLHVLRGSYAALVVYVNQHRKMPVVTRNIDLSELRIPDAAPRLLIADHCRKMLHLDIAPLAGGLAWVLTGDYAWGLAGVTLGLAAGLAGCALMAVQARRNAHLGNPGRVMAVVSQRLREHAPEVVLYFAGSRDSAYQVNMWLSTLGRLDRPAMIMMRERWMVPLLGPTSLPVVCVDGMVDLVNSPLPGSVRVALFPNNSSKNLHLLRMPGLRHVFINHGDSDKSASANPFAKAYDDVWVAGPAGRDRYRRAQVGVRDEVITEVGRPQLEDIAAARPAAPGRMLTVLYAPTWEGWDEEVANTSLERMGLRLVTALLQRDPRIRLIYKPHPLTGTRDARLRQAHAAMVARIEAANQARGGGPDPQAAADLERIGTRLRELTGDGRILGSNGARGGGAIDYAMLSRDAMADPARDQEWQQLLRDWHEAYWRRHGSEKHLVVTGPRPALYDCFGQADLLITDVSSVLADFLVTGRPYAITNIDDRAAEELRRDVPTSSAGYLLGTRCTELPEILAQAGLGRADRLAADRQLLRHYLLGPDTPGPQARFNAAIAALIGDSGPAGQPGPDAAGPAVPATPAPATRTSAPAAASAPARR